jgi:hypothetical protein
MTFSGDGGSAGKGGSIAPNIPACTSRNFSTSPS